MTARQPFSVSTALGQGVLVLAGLLVVASWPPERGRLLLVPVWPGSVRAIAADLEPAGMATGTRIIAIGPVAGSVVVVNDTPGFRWKMMLRGVLPLAGTGGCGAFLRATVA